MMRKPAVCGMALLLLTFIVNEDQTFVAAHNCGGIGLGQFERVYSADFETYEDCEVQCGYVTGEAEAICKAAEGGACIGESAFALLTGGGVCQATGGACTTTEAAYIGLKRKCEEYCDGKYPSKFEKIQGNVNQTRKVLLKGQADIKDNLEKLTESIATKNKKLTEELILAQEKIIDNVVEEIENSESIILDSLHQSKIEILNSLKQTTSGNQEEVLRHLREFSNASLTHLTSIENSLEKLGKDLQYNIHINLFGDVFKILDTIETRYTTVQHDQQTGLIVRNYESDQYTAAVTDPNHGMLIGIKDIKSMLITGDGKNWAKSKSIYEENPQEFCNQNWFSLFSLKLTRSLFHYRNGRRMQGNPVPASHSEKKYHEEHYEHYSKICQCSKEDLPTINNRTVKCKETYSNSNLGDVCQVECWGQDRDSVFCEEGGEWTVDKLWLEEGDQGTWACKDSEVLFIGPGLGSNGQSEVLNLPSLTRANCTPPTFPYGDYEGYVASLMAEGPLLCGGYYSGKRQSTCHLAGKEWTASTPMKTTRHVATAVTLGDAWWVTGGHDGSSWLATTELLLTNLTSPEWTPHIDLPHGVKGHCLVKLNTTHVFLTGGVTGTDSISAACFIYSTSTGFVRVMAMSTARSYHACSLHSDNLVFVAGGYKDPTPGGFTFTALGVRTKTTEYFSLTTLDWQHGPDLPISTIYKSYPISTRGANMIRVNSETLWMGGEGKKKIFKLQTSDNWKWVEVGEMKSPRNDFQVLKMKFSDCVKWSN